MRRIADQLAAGFAKLPGSARYRRLAVLAFSEVGPETKRRELGTVVAAELSTNLRRDHGLLLVEREKLGSVLAEAKLGAMGLTDARAAPKLGELADAQALVVGSVSDAGGKFLVNARILSAESAETLAAANEVIPAATLVALSADAVVLRSRGDAVFRSLLVPGLGQVYNRQPVKGAVYVGATALLAGGAVWFHLAGTSKEQEYRDYRPPGGGADGSGAAAALRDDAQGLLRLRNGFVLGAAAVWLVNVADAYLFGVDGGAVAVAPAPLAGGAALAVAGRF
jgi:TolB-like protein